MNQYIYLFICLFMGQTLLAQHDIFGNIHQLDNTPITDVTVDLSGHTTSSTLNNSAGDYTFSNLDVGFDYTVTPSKNTNYLECVTVADILDISKHILGIQSLSNYNIIAADVNNSSSLTSFDIIQIRQLILGINTTFSNADSWEFIDANQTLDPNNPFNDVIRNSVAVNSLSTDTQVDFIGVKKGNVNECYTLDAAYMQLSMGTATACQGDVITVPVTVHNFVDVMGLQFSMQYDDALLQFNGVQNFATNSNISTANFNTNTSGQLSFAWTASNLQGLHLTDGSVLFELAFQVLGSANTTSNITFSNTPTIQELVTAANTKHEIFTQDGQVIIDCTTGSCTGNNNIYMESTASSVQTGDQITIDVKADGFIGVAGMQFSINFDPNELQYDSESNLNSTLGLNNGSHLITTDANNGIITVAWIDNNLQGQTLPDGSILFSLHFTVLSNFTGDIDIEFSDTPTACSFYDSAIQALIFDKCGLELIPNTASYPSQYVVTVGDNGDFACSSSFTDDGGTSGLYNDNAAPTYLILCPDVPTNRIQLTFIQFDIANGDEFSVYDTDQPFTLNTDGSIQTDASGHPILQSNLPVPDNVNNPSSGGSVSNAPGSGFARASCSNTSGCLSVVWQPNNDNIKGAGWEYFAVCIDRSNCPSNCTLTCNDQVSITLSNSCVADLWAVDIVETPCPNETYTIEVTHNASNITKSGNMVVVDADHIGDNTVKITDSNNTICWATLYVQDPQNNCTDVCDDDNIIHPNAPISAGDYKAEQTITSEGMVTSGSNVLYQAGTNITLLPNFHAQANSSFQAIIKPCTLTPLVPEDDYSFKITETTEEDSPQIQLFPNPTNSATNLKLFLPNTATVKIIVTDLTGRVVSQPIQQQLGEGWHQSNIITQQLPNGIYIVQIQAGDTYFAERLSVTN